VSPCLRTVKTGSGATAVQIVHSSRRGSREIEHIGSAHDGAALELLKAAARQWLAAGQGELELGLDRTEPARRGSGGAPLPITGSRMRHLWDALSRGYHVLGFETGADLSWGRRLGAWLRGAPVRGRRRACWSGAPRPSANFDSVGRFNDKPSLKVDDWSVSGDPFAGNVYVAWTLFTGGFQNQILFTLDRRRRHVLEADHRLRGRRQRPGL
jgi:hypothetical protein